MSFGRFPNEWVLDDGLRSFTEAVRPGESLAALKLYLLIAAYADFHSWTAVMSFSEIEDMTRLSRPMVNAAVKMLTAQGLVVKGRVKQTSSYELVHTSGNWSKVPQDKIRSGLRSIPNRGRISLCALKAYILLLSMRDSKDSTTSISYGKISSYTKIRPADVRLALSTLVVSGFIQIGNANQEKFPSDHNYNIYYMLGDFAGKLAKHKRPKLVVQPEELDIPIS